MAESIFDDPTRAPDAGEVAEGLGARAGLWDQLLALTPASKGRTEWSFYKKSTGWILLMKQGKLTLCTLMPSAEALDVIFLLPERAVEAAREAELPPAVVERMESAKSYKVGRPFRVSVHTADDVPAVETLIAIKAASAKR
jgi:hypothetical protein